MPQRSLLGNLNFVVPVRAMSAKRCQASSRSPAPSPKRSKKPESLGHDLLVSIRGIGPVVELVFGNSTMTALEVLKSSDSPALASRYILRLPDGRVWEPSVSASHMGLSDAVVVDAFLPLSSTSQHFVHSAAPAALAVLVSGFADITKELADLQRASREADLSRIDPSLERCVELLDSTCESLKRARNILLPELPSAAR